MKLATCRVDGTEIVGIVSGSRLIPLESGSARRLTMLDVIRRFVAEELVELARPTPFSAKITPMAAAARATAAPAAAKHLLCREELPSSRRRVRPK